MSKETGKERGFFLCENHEGKLIPSRSCEGTECSIHLGDPRTGCPPNTKTYGDFHSHPYLYSAKQELKRGVQVSHNEELRMDEELKAVMCKNIREIHERVTRVKDVTINTPSYTDILKALLSKYLDVTNGTVCTSTDRNRYSRMLDDKRHI